MDHAGERRSLREIELTKILPEEGLRGLAEAVDRVAAVWPRFISLAYISKICCLLKRFSSWKVIMISVILREMLLVRREEESSRKLLGERGAAAVHAVREDILHGALGGAEVVDAAVLEEAAVFDGDDGLHHVRRDLVVGDEAALGAVLVFGEGGDELRLELVACQGGAVFGGDGLHHAVGGDDGGAVGGEVALRAGLDWMLSP